MEGLVRNDEEEAFDLYGPKRDNLFIVIPITVIYVIILLSGLIGNISTCVVIARNKSMHTATNYYLFSLAISDLLLLVSGLPPEIYSMWSRYPYIFGNTFCILRGLFAETSANATVLTITAFTVERYVAICHPFLSHTMSKLSRVIKIILLIWCIAVGFAIPQAIQFEVSEDIEGNPQTSMCHILSPLMEYSFDISTLVFFVIPMTLITVLYAMIGLKLKSSTMVSNQISLAGAKKLQAQSSRRVLKMLVAVVVAFFICWAPFHAQRLVATHVSFPSNADDRIKYLKIYEVVTYISGVLYFVSTTINPLLYNIMSNKFRDAFKETFARCCRLKSGKQRTYSVLSRSRSSAPRATESNESRDEAISVQTHTSVTHKSSIDSGLGMHITAKRSRKIEFPNRSEVSITMVPLTNLTHISPSTKLVAVHVMHAPEPNWRILEFFRCLGSKRREPASPEFRVRTKETRLSGDSFDISNSSLKEVEAALLKDELTTYMNKPTSIN